MYRDPCQTTGGFAAARFVFKAAFLELRQFARLIPIFAAA